MWKDTEASFNGWDSENNTDHMRKIDDRGQKGAQASNVRVCAVYLMVDHR
jgi:hypothetical protein